MTDISNLMKHMILLYLIKYGRIKRKKIEEKGNSLKGFSFDNLICPNMCIYNVVKKQMFAEIMFCLL